MDNQNPFAAPAESAAAYVAPAETVDGNAPLRIATTGKRLANFILDWIFLQIVSLIFVIFLAIAGMAEIVEGAGGYLIGIVLGVIYYGGQELIGGRTLAKLITGTMVVNEFGEHPTPGQILGRTLCRFIPFELFSFLGGKGHPVGWHDSISGTRVVQI